MSAPARRFILLSIVFFAIIPLCNATHIRGGYLTGERISTTSFTYRFTVTLFRDNGGVPPQPGTISFGYASATDVLVEPVSLGFIDGLQDTQGDATEILIYQIDHTFPTEGTYKVSYFEQNRNPGVRNMFASGNTAFFLESTFVINPSNSINSSPTFSNQICNIGYIGQIYSYNFAAFDADGDSLSYRLSVPLQGLDEEGNSIAVENYLLPNALSYQAERSDGQGRAIFQIDATTGQLIFDAPGSIGEYNAAIVVDEWRNGLKIGTVNYDFQIIIIDSPDFIFCPEEPNNTGISITLPENAYIDFEEDYSQSGFIVSNADSFEVNNDLFEAGKVSIQSETTETENGLEHTFTLDISNLTIEDAIRTFYVFEITGFKDGESFSRRWYLKVDNVASSSEELLSKGLKFFPNPVSSQLTIETKIPLGDAKITLIDSTGKRIRNFIFPFQAKNYKIDTSGLADGFYIINLQSSDGMASWKFLKI